VSDPGLALITGGFTVAAVIVTFGGNYLLDKALNPRAAYKPGSTPCGTGKIQTSGPSSLDASSIARTTIGARRFSGRVLRPAIW
jgi:hypothetical protein